jgi:type IV secretory pathway VirB10-like protein
MDELKKMLETAKKSAIGTTKKETEKNKEKNGNTQKDKEDEEERRKRRRRKQKRVTRKIKRRREKTTLYTAKERTKCKRDSFVLNKGSSLPMRGAKSYRGRLNSLRMSVPNRTRGSGR